MTSPTAVMAFELAGTRYALPLDAVREVVRAVAITPLPGAPAVVEGVIDVRGRVLPVLDIRRRFGLEPRPLHPNDHFLLALAGDRLVALRIDLASGLLELDARDIEDATEISSGRGYIAGVAKTGAGLVLIHNLETFLSEAEAEAMEAALEKD